MDDNKIQNLGLLYEYSENLMDQLPAYSDTYFGVNTKLSAAYALEVCRYAFKYFMHWDPATVKAGISGALLEQLKLTDMFGRIASYYPEGEDVLKADNYAFFVHLLYPKEIPFSRDKLVRKLYQEVREGKRPRFPKKYFDGWEGRKKAAVCLNYLIQQELPGHFHDIREMYEYFASQEGLDLISDNGLTYPLKTIFKTPVLFFHESLPYDDRDPLWFHYAEFQYLFKSNLDDEAIKSLRKYKALQEQKKEIWNKYNSLGKCKAISLSFLGRKNEPEVYEHVLTKAINLKKPFWVQGIDNMYRWFLSEEGDAFLERTGLNKLFPHFYDSKVDYLHIMLDGQEGNEVLYHYHKFERIWNHKDAPTEVPMTSVDNDFWNGDDTEDDVSYGEREEDEEGYSLPSFIKNPDFIAVL